MLAYGLVLWAQTRGALAPIAALRETSVIFGAIIGTLVFREPFGRTRVAATVLVRGWHRPAQRRLARGWCLGSFGTNLSPRDPLRPPDMEVPGGAGFRRAPGRGVWTGLFLPSGTT